MPGLPIFLVRENAIEPGTSQIWSYSALSEFEECPKRWALARTAVPCFGGKVPQKPNRTTVEGTLLHSLLESLASHDSKDGLEPFRPRRALLSLVADWAENNANNPRIDSKALAGQIRIEEVLRAFAEARAFVTRDEWRSSGTARRTASTRMCSGAESWLRDPASNLRGKADLISFGVIVDFKIGEKEDHHIEQITFYGALYFAVTERPPVALRLVYTATNDVLEVPVPTRTELELLIDAMRKRASRADGQVASGHFPAKPEQSKCTYCHVRGLCTEYWKGLHKDGQSAAVAEVPFVDYTPTGDARFEPAAFGLYLRDKFIGRNSVLHLPQEVADEMKLGARSLRILALRPNEGADEIRFAFTTGSEVYIIE